MEPTDWAVSSAIFVVAVAATMAVAPSLLPQKAQVFSESQMQSILESVSDEIQVKSILLKTDCNSSQYDCNREFPVEIDLNESKHNMFSQAYTQDGNKMYSVMSLGAVTKLYSFAEQKITPSYSTSAFTLSSSGDTNYADSYIIVSNQYLDANITDSIASIDFTDSNEKDITIAYPEMKMSRLQDAKTSVVVGNDTNKFYLRFFPNSAEFWIDVPEDINISINPMHQNWKSDENIGMLNNDTWWDDDSTDAYLWHYRIPITVNAMDYARYDLNVRADINFALQKQRLGISGQAISTESFRLVEYSNMLPYDSTTAAYSNSLALSNQPFEISYLPGTEIASLDWTLTGFTAARATRVYYLYFDLSGYPKTSYSYSTVNYTEPEHQVYITVAFPQETVETYVFDTNKIFLYNPNTLLINTENQLSRRWQYNAVGYRKPLLFDSGTAARSEMFVSADINFAQEFSTVGCPDCDLNTESIALVQANNWDEGEVTETLARNDANISGAYNYSYNPSTKAMNIAWSVPSTAISTKRYYFLYYDSNS
ncbi:MAG: hypothetical protein NT067_05040 [Candidatus Diapherotrites archaeon]|nr:hypothetical protein [Candidatus Diapherotrites archaeon]